MGPALLILFACLPAAAADTPAARALVRVVVAEKKLDVSARQHHLAVKEKSKAAKEAIAAAANFNTSRPREKDEAKAEVLEARRDLRAAKLTAVHTGAEYVGSGRNYIIAENAYHQATGEFHDVRRYDLVRAQLKLPPRPGAPPPPPLDGPAPVQADDALIQAINDGQVTTPEMERRAEQLSQAGDLAVSRALDTRFASGPGAGRPSGSGLAEGSASARTDSAGAAAANLDRAVMLSRPSGDQSAAAAGRFLSAGADRLRTGDPAGALEAAEAALKANPRDAKAWAQKAAALNKLGRYAEAESAAQAAVQLDPGNARAYRDLAWAQLHLGKPDEAEKNATRMIFLDPDNPEGYLLRAFAYELKGDRARMMADLERAAALDARYANHLARARAGLRLFDPNAADAEGIFNALPPPPQKPVNHLLRFGVLLVALGALAVAVLAVQARAVRRAAPPRTAVPAPEPLVGGRFRKGRPAGRGGFGQVYEAVDESLGRAVALEEVPSDRIEEARAAAALPRPGGPEVYEILELPSALVLVWSRPPT